MAEFQTGLFSQTPTNSAARTGFATGSDPTSFLMNSASRAATKTDGNAFDTFTKPLRRKQREKVVAEAQAIGLSPTDPEFYTFTAKKLGEIGDNQGAEMAVNRGLQLKGQIATARKTTADAVRAEQLNENELDERKVRATERSVDVSAQNANTASRRQANEETPAERLAKLEAQRDLEQKRIDISRGQLGVQRGKLDILREDLKNAVTPEERLSKLNAEIELEERKIKNETNRVNKLETPEQRRQREESLARIRTTAAKDVALLRERAATTAALIEEGSIAEDIKTSDVTLASNALLGEIYQRVEVGGDVTNDNFMQLWGEFAGQDMEDVIEASRSTTVAERKEAERVLASMAQAVAINEKMMKKNFPNMPQAKRLDLAIAMGPNGGRVLEDPSTGTIRIVTVDGAVLEEVR